MLKVKLSALLLDKSKNEEFSGVVLIRRGEEELFSGVYGYANRTWKVKNTLDTRFRIASITKMFTAVSILQLVEENKFNLDTKIVELLELENTKIPERVTIYELLTHTSGIADYYDEMGSNEDDWERMWEDKPIYSMRELSDYFPLFAYKEPVSKPGQKFYYNGAGYILLGMAVEKVSGLSYFDYVRRNVFSKLGMKDSDFLSLDEVYDNVAEGYEVIMDKDNNIKGWKKNVYTTTPEAASDGGSSSTAHDLIKFIQSLRNNKLLPKDMTERILSPYVLDEVSNGFKGYIWKYGFANYFLLDQDENIVRGGHTGEEYGASARLYYYPSQNIDVVILGNQGLCAGSVGWGIHDLITESNI